MAKTRSGEAQQSGSGNSLTNPENLIDVAKLKYFEEKLATKNALATVAETRSALSELT